MFSFHLASVGAVGSARLLLRPPPPHTVDGLRCAEWLHPMRLGVPLASPRRWTFGQVGLLARWDDEAALDRFLDEHADGRRLAEGWHVRLTARRRWGSMPGFDDLPVDDDDEDLDAPVVVVTLARLRLSQSLRFMRWGTPVESLVSDSPGVILALGASRPLSTLATFSLWASTRDMLDMVHGRTDVADADRHVAAMAERDRKDFHRRFTTLRFSPVSEHGTRPSYAEITAGREGRSAA